MNIKKYVSVAIWTLGAIAMVPALASSAAADETKSDAPIPLEGSQCWGRCSACAARCASAVGAERGRCERTCQGINDNCCEASGRHGSARTCGCY